MGLRRGQDGGGKSPEIAVGRQLDDVDGELIRDSRVEGPVVVGACLALNCSRRAEATRVRRLYA